MADDIVVTTGTSGNVSTVPNNTRFSLEEVSTLNGGAVTAALVQRIIMAMRTADGTALDVNSTNPMPVSLASAPLGTGAATAANQATVITALASLLSAVDGLEALIAAQADSSEAQPVSDNGGSLTVDGTFWQATQPVSAASLPLPTGAATEAELESITAAVLAVGTAIGDLATLTEVQPVKEVRAGTPTQSTVANATSSTSLLAANANRLGATIFNDDTATTGATLKVKLGATASASSFTVSIAPQGYYEVPFGYTGAIDGIASAATGNARITEVAA